MKDFIKNKEEEPDVINQFDNAGRRSLSIDYQLYLPLLEGCELTEAQKREFLDTLWSIVNSFVDLGFGIHPLQQVCGQEINLANIMTSSVNDVVKEKGKPSYKQKPINDRKTNLTLERMQE